MLLNRFQLVIIVYFSRLNLLRRALDAEMRKATRAVARALIGGGGGCIFIYSCYARLISFEINPNDN